MNKILKIFLALVLTVSMMFEIIPVNTIHADEEVPVSETGATEPATEEKEGEEAEDPAVPTEVETEEVPPVEPAENDDSVEPEAPTEVEAPTEIEKEETDLPEEESWILNENAFSEEYTVGDLKVTVSYGPGTVPEGTEVFVSEASEEALNAIKEQYGEDVSFSAVDISFVFEDEEIEPKDYSDKKVSVVFSYNGEETPAETVHLKESINEDGEVEYSFETIATVVVPETETIQVPVYEKEEITEKVNVPYEYKWTETVKKYKEVDVYGDVEVEYEEEVPVYETREITEERTEYVTKTRQVEKTRTVKVKVDFVWWNPLTWLGYKYVTEKYYVTETYKEPVTITVVVGTEEVQVGTETVTKTRTERQVIGKETVEDGEEEVVHTETRYREEEVGIGQYELVLKGYSEETVTVGQTISFEADDFSTFVVAWGNSTVTVHYGYMQNGSFQEFAANESTNPDNYPGNKAGAGNTLNASSYNYGSSAYLIYDFDGYKYAGTYLTNNNNPTSNPLSGTTSIRPQLYSNGWNSRQWEYSTGGWGTTALTSGRHIYVVYEKKTTTNGYVPSEDPDDPDQPGPGSYVPEIGKNVSDMKSDGTYDITLSVLGHEDTSEEVVKARVIVVFDVSGSMRDEMESGSTRMQVAQRAVNKLAETLLAKEDSQGNKLVDFGLVTYSSDATKRTFTDGEFTSNYSNFSSVVNGLNANGGTNWEAGIDLANSMTASTYGKTYIVFISDGEPTFRTSRGDLTDSQVATDGYDYNGGNIRFGAGNHDNQGANYDRAALAAKSVHDHDKEFYAVGLSSDVESLEDLAEFAEGNYYDGSNETQFAEALENIASAIENSFGLTEVEINDGVTELTEIETQSLIGTAGNFVYRKGTNADPSQNDEWEGAPEAKINSDNSVTWDLSEAGKLDNGVLYSVSFTVWPKQEAYDLIADLDNEIKKITDLDASTKKQLRVLINGTTYEYDGTSWTGDLSDAALQNIIDLSSSKPVYSTKTNTGLSASYTYGGIPGSHEYTNYTNGNMTLDVETFGVKKLWNNVLPQDTRSAKMLTDDEGYLINKNKERILVDGQPIHYRDANAKQYAVLYVELIVTKGDANYEEVTVYSSDGWQLDDIFISLGVLSVSSDGKITVREKGHEYSIKEKPADAYYWELEATTYRPMVINGTTTMLEKVEKDDEDYQAASGVAGLTCQTIEGVEYYNFEGNVYRKIPTQDAVLKATNHRRSYLNLTKVVNEEDAPEDALFEYEITITIPGVKHHDEEGFNVDIDPVWFSVFADGAPVMDLEVSDNVTAEEDGGQPTGYFYVDSGEKFTVKMKANWNYRSSNLLTGTTYVITEKEDTMEPGFVFEKVEPTAVSWKVVDGEYQEYDVVYEAEVDGSTIEGEIVDTNTAYTVTYTNDYLGVFYVYHSSDNTVERFPMAVNGKAYSEDNTFSIYDLTKVNTLYGGYYKDYAGKSDGYDSTKLIFDENDQSADTNGTAYSYQYIKDSGKSAWDSSNDNVYTENGDEMIPVKNTTYFLKEVPDSYLLPYTHYTYYKESKNIGGLLTLTAIDDLNYSKNGFIVETGDEEAIIVDSLKVTAQNNSASTTTLTAYKLYRGKGVQDGYLGYAEITKYMKKDSSALIKQYWTTLDGITVKGKVMRTLSFGDCTVNSTGLKKTDAPCND